MRYMRLIPSFKSKVTHEFCRVDEYNIWEMTRLKYNSLKCEYEGAITLNLEADTFSKCYYVIINKLGDAEETPCKKRQSLSISRYANAFVLLY